MKPIGKVAPQWWITPPSIVIPSAKLPGCKHKTCGRSAAPGLQSVSMTPSKILIWRNQPTLFIHRHLPPVAENGGPHDELMEWLQNQPGLLKTVLPIN